jgi:hypothetical protein
MFAKRSKQSSQRQPPSDDGSQTEQSGSHSRGTSIERLERELEEQRAETLLVRQELDAAAFKAETLEKSYAKQLAELREKLAVTQEDLKTKEEILTNLGGGHEHTLRELSDAVAVIKVLKKERDQLRKQIAQGGFRQGYDRPAYERPAYEQPTNEHEVDGRPTYEEERPPNERPARPRSVVQQMRADVGDTSDGTINSLIANAGWAQKKPGVGTGQATATVEAPEPERSKEEMLSPDLVFTEKDKEKDDTR